MGGGNGQCGKRNSRKNLIKVSPPPPPPTHTDTQPFSSRKWWVGENMGLENGEKGILGKVC